MENLKQIVGKTLLKVDQHDEEIVFTFSDGSIGRFYHIQDCCEFVRVEDVTGDWNDLLNTPLLVADERTSGDETEWGGPLWTFYTFRTVKGTVDVRWLGESNGYYSEEVSFYLTTPETDQ